MATLVKNNGSKYNKQQRKEQEQVNDLKCCKQEMNLRYSF